MDLPPNPAAPLAGREIHGFNSLADLDTERLMKEAYIRWFRPNEVHAILSNYRHFKVQPQPVDRPKSGTVLLFDRKVLRNFRKDGYNWKKKKDGKNVQEAHEKLKIGNEERVHVYYARSDEDPNFYRRSFWLLDKNLERIVLVHYRQTLEESVFPNPPIAVECADPVPYNNMMDYNSPVTPINSTSGSAHSDLSGSAVLSEEINSGEEQAAYTGSRLYPVDEHAQTQNNDFGWGDLEDPCTDFGSNREGYIPSSGQNMQYGLFNSPRVDNFLLSQGISSSEHPSVDKNNGIDGVKQVNRNFHAMEDGIYPDNFLLSQGLSSSEHPSVDKNNGIDGVKQVNRNFHAMEEDHNRQSPLFNYVNPHFQVTDFKSTPVDSSETSRLFADGVLTNQEGFGRLNYVNDESLRPLDCLQFDYPILSGGKSDASGRTDHFYSQGPIFTIVDFSPEWAYSTVETKVVVVGTFNEPYKHLSRSKIYCVFGETCVATEIVQDGVYRCTTSSHIPGLVNFFLTLDGHTPISQVLPIEHRPIPIPQSNGELKSLGEGNSELKRSLSQVQTRLSHLLFSTSNTISILSNKIQPKFLREAKRYETLTSSLVEKNWTSLLKLSGEHGNSDVEDLFELFLKNKLQEWLLLKVAEGCKITPLDSQGQGVIHLCVILDYVWSVRLFSLSGFSLDFRDANGWTALHWAASYGREKMVAALLSAGANPSLVTNPTPRNPGGCTAADLAFKEGYEGLAAYLAEKGLMAHFRAMALSGNTTAPPPPTSSNVVNAEYSDNLTEQELCLKESLAAYRNAADAADRIQAAFRECALKQQTKAVQLANPVVEATQIVAALKIQHAFRNHCRRRLMKAAAHIQSHFRTLRARRDFLNMRRQAIKIQAAFRGRQARKQYNKIIWSVGVLEKAILRWRLQRKGLRGMQTETTEAMKVDNVQEENVAEEDFFRIGREQAEERVKNSVVKVQSMFRSYQAQQEYRRMKLAHEKAKLEFNLDDEVGNP